MDPAERAKPVNISARQMAFLDAARKLSVTEARDELAKYKDMRLRRWALMYVLVFDHNYTHGQIAKLAGITNAAARNALLMLNTKKAEEALPVTPEIPDGVTVLPVTLPEITPLLEIEYMRLDQLRDHPQNPKNHSS